jgi:kynurenine 3-monooxygenase
LALAARGIHALKAAGVFDGLESTLLPMRGRLIHYENRETAFQRYGQRPDEVIYSVSRHRLNQALIEAAASRPGVRLHFQHRLEGADFAANTAQIRDLENDRVLAVPMQPLLATDGAGSAVRRAMSARKLIQASEIDLEHGYKELSIPAGKQGSFRMARDALHIWPRGNFMLIALPNADGSFTATLFLPKHGPVSFASLRDADSVDEFLTHNFPDARACHGSVSRPRHELLFRGLHRIRCLRGAACVLGGRVCGIRRRSQAQHRCHRRHGARKLPGDARKRCGAQISAAAGTIS